MKWHQKELRKQAKEILTSGIFYLIVILSLSLWYFGIGKEFMWIPIEALDAPSIFSRLFYSALTFVTLGRILYKIKFYKFLYIVLGDWRSFKKAKALVWAILLYFMFLWVVPKFFDLLNAIISFGYNILNLILFLFPPVGVSIIVFIIGMHIHKKIRDNKQIVLSAHKN